MRDTLNIGMDSMVFRDDNPFERNLVRSMIPEICVPELPSDPALYLSYIQSLNLFETVSYSSEDADRTSMYQAEAKRRESEAAFSTIDDYLKMTRREILTTAGRVSHQQALDKAHDEYKKYKAKEADRLSLVEKHFLESIQNLENKVEK